MNYRVYQKEYILPISWLFSPALGVDTVAGNLDVFLTMQ